jgi:hypothetical protein
MQRNSHESLWLLTPFIMWGAIVLIMHSLGYVTLTKVRGGRNIGERPTGFLPQARQA